MKKFYAIVLAIGFLTVSALAANGSAARSWEAPKVLKPAKDIQVTEGQPVQIEVQFSDGGAPGVVDIFFNGKPITASDRIKISIKEDGRVILYISKVLMSDAGEYTFKLSNPIGTVSTSMKLYVAKPE